MIYLTNSTVPSLSFIFPSLGQHGQPKIYAASDYLIPCQDHVCVRLVDDWQFLSILLCLKREPERVRPSLELRTVGRKGSPVLLTFDLHFCISCFRFMNSMLSGSSPTDPDTNSSSLESFTTSGPTILLSPGSSSAGGSM